VGSSSALPNPSAGFVGPLRGWGKREKRRKIGEKENKERNGRKHPSPSELNKLK